MFSKFLNLEPEKQERILDAAMKEFAQKGFENASTNEIVKEAGISKGLLFHYFTNKKSLYLFLYDYCIDLCMNEFYENINLEENDIFIRLRQALLIKFELIKKYPKIFAFVEVAYMENSKDVKNTLEHKNEEFITDSYSKIFENIDICKFREGIDIKRAINIIIWTLNGFGEQELKKETLSTISKIDYETAFAEADIYIDLLIKCFYRNS
jgi:TetR/AcrR family transcriptional regulator